MDSFTPLSALTGGILIGLAAALLLIANGRIAGISGIVGGLLPPRSGDATWRAWFLGGLLGAGALVAVVHPGAFEAGTHRSTLALAAAGLLVGFGTQLGNGCTSGHGVCGISRLSARSIVATVVFMATGAITVFVVDHVIGGAS